MNNLDITRETYKKAQELANRWVKAWHQSFGYPLVGDVQIDFCNNLITFQALPSCSGIGFPQSINTKYLEDDSTLEQDAKVWYGNYIKDRNEKSELERVLSNSPDVIAWRKLKNIDSYGFPLNGLHGIII